MLSIQNGKELVISAAAKRTRDTSFDEKFEKIYEKFNEISTSR
jgi:hypothetical protein